MRDHRGSSLDAAPFPSVRATLATGSTCSAGTENFSGRNAIDQDIIELNDAYTLMKGKHQWTIGTHNEFLDLANLFIRDAFGNYPFSILANFEAGFAQGYDRSFSATSDPEQRAAFKVRQWGFYVGDQWRVKPSVTLTYGVRIDAPTYPTKPTANPLAVSTFGYATDVVPNQVHSRRAPASTGTSAATARSKSAAAPGSSPAGRPTSGSRTSTGNTGIDFNRIGATFNATANRIPFVADPLGQPTTVTGAAAGTFTNEIDMIDPDFNTRRSSAATSATTGSCGADSRATSISCSPRRSRTSPTRTSISR